MKTQNAYIRHFKKTDPILAGLIKQISLPATKPQKNHFQSLVVSIINQQLSGKAADTIEKRFRALFGAKKFPTPEQVFKTPVKKLRGVGLSGQKVLYIKHLAGAIKNKQLNLAQLKKLADEQVITELVKLKGIGRWTAEMFLMFSLNRPNVFSHGDLGLKNAIKKWYKLELKTQPKKYLAITEKFSPHSTLAARYLWASLKLK